MAAAVIDAHQHFWDPGRLTYPWMRGEAVAPLCRPFLPGDLEPILRDAGVDRTVVVQAQSSLDETRWLLDLADANAFIAGVVGWVDLTSCDLPGVLDELEKGPKFKGVRHQAEDEPDGWLNRPDVLGGLGELARRGIPYDLLVRPGHLRSVRVIADRLPELRMVVDHMAKPRIASRRMDPWAGDLAQVAGIPAVSCKLSGMITEADWKAWTPGDLKPYIDHVVEQFGFDRVMFGSDWPVCVLAGTYARVLEALNDCLGEISASDRAKVFGENARAFYKLT